jgi:hypothetical protein
MNPGTSKPPIKTLPLSRSRSLSLSSESAILQLQEAVADEIEDESLNFKTTHQKHCKGSTKIKTTAISIEIVSWTTKTKKNKNKSKSKKFFFTKLRL